MLKARTTKEEVVNAIEGLLSAGSPVTLLNVWEAMGKRNERGEIVPEQYTLISQKERNIFLEKVKSLGRTLPLDKEDEDRVKCRRCLLDDFDNNKKCLTCGESLELGYPLAFSAWGMDFYIDKALISPGGLTFEDFFRDYEKRIVIQLGGFQVLVLQIGNS